MFDDATVIEVTEYPDAPVMEGGGCSATCGICFEPCTKVPEHHGQHYCPTHAGY